MDNLELRRKAEQSIGTRPRVELFEQRSQDVLIDELQVHQLELEIQNEELRRVQVELEETTARYFDLFDLSPVGYVTLDRTGRIVEVNRTAEDLLGASRERLSQRAITRLMSEPDADAFQLHLRRVFQDRTPERLHLRISKADGTSIPVLLASTVPPERDTCLMTMIDLTDKRRIEKELREATARFQELTDHIDEVFFVYQPSQRRVIYLSPAITHVLDVEPSAILERQVSLLDWVHPDDRMRVRRAAAGLLRGDPFDHELRVIRANDVRIVRIRAFGVDQDRVAGVLSDVTEERGLEEELRHAQKMEAVGALASGIAHDFNNLLMGVIGFATVALTRMDPSQPGHREIKRVVEVARRGEGLTRQLLDFSRKRPIHAEPLELDAVVRSCGPLIETLVGDAVRVETKTTAPGARIRAKAGEIEQVMMNLATNARDSMPNGGLLQIVTAEIATDAEDELHRGRWVTLSVRDGGTGMSEETRRRIFEPFFTTKGVGKGTGLGLSTTFGLVRRLGGRIEVETQVGAGSTFTIHLPTVPETAELAREELTLQGSGSVLVVEDDPFVREAVAYYLSRAGYTALMATSPQQAIELAMHPATLIDLLLTDVMMPRQLGRELADELRAVRPGIKVVYMSAHPREELLERGRIEPDAMMIQKPFDEHGLGMVLYRALLD